MRIAIIAPLVTAIREPQLGGSQSLVADLAAGLTVRHHVIHLYAAAGSTVAGVTVIDTGIDPGALRDSLYRADSPTRRASAQAESAFARVYAAVRTVPYDLVHNHAFDAPAIRLARGLPMPVVHTLHLPPDPAVAAALGEARRSDQRPTVAAVSTAQAAGWRALTEIDVVLRDGVPTVRIPWSTSPGCGAVFAGRFSREKGAAEAVDIAAAAGMSIDVYGDPYDLSYVEEHITPRRRTAGVSFHPAVERIVLWEIMARASVVLCPARWEEPFGMVAAEAQAAGTPVVAFRRGGLGEVIADGLTGYLVPPDDIAAAAQAVAKVRCIARAECRRHAERWLDLESCLDAHEALYRRVAPFGQVAIDA